MAAVARSLRRRYERGRFGGNRRRIGNGRERPSLLDQRQLDGRADLDGADVREKFID